MWAPLAKHTLLMIPGPSEVDPRVLAALSRPVLPHYGKRWGEFHAKILEDLAKVFETNETVILLPVPGQLALEMAAVNLLTPTDKAVVCTNGYFGDLTDEIVRSQGCSIIHITAPDGQPIEPAAVEAALEQAGDVKAVFIVHNETSTGVVNPIQEIGEVVRRHSALFVVDAISSFGGMRLETDRWNIDFCVGYASKCLGAINGVVPIVVGRRVWKTLEKRQTPIRSRFLNLLTWRRFMKEWGSIGHPYPSTMPSSVIVALRRALDLAFEEGLDRRYARHAASAELMRNGVEGLGLHLFPRRAAASNTVTVVQVPVGSESRIRHLIEEKFNIMIGGGITRLNGKVIRIGHMGRTASPYYIRRVLSALRMALSSLGLLPPTG